MERVRRRSWTARTRRRDRARARAVDRSRDADALERGRLTSSPMWRGGECFAGSGFPATTKHQQHHGRPAPSPAKVEVGLGRRRADNRSCCCCRSARRPGPPSLVGSNGSEGGRRRRPRPYRAEDRRRRWFRGRSRRHRVARARVGGRAGRRDLRCDARDIPAAPRCRWRRRVRMNRDGRAGDVPEVLARLGHDAVARGVHVDGPHVAERAVGEDSGSHTGAGTGTSP